MRRLPFLLIVAALTSCAWINEHDPGCPRGLPRRRDRPTDEGARQTVDAVIFYGSTP